MALDGVLYTTKQSKVTKSYASNHLEWLMSATNHAFSLAMPIDHTYQCHVLVQCNLDYPDPFVHMADPGIPDT